MTNSNAAPGHTDLMVDPETLDTFLDANPLPFDINAPRRTIYLAGPMKGIEGHNYPAFHRAAGILRAFGHHVFNPAEYPHFGPREAFPLRPAFAAYTNFICLTADAIVLLPGWKKSVGANAERALARAVGIDVFEWRETGDVS